jgi:hypothetical protein
MPRAPVGASSDDQVAAITTERLLLSPLRAEDASELVDVLGDERLHEFVGGRPDTLEELRARYAGLLRGSPNPGELWLNWIVRRRSGSQAIGTLQATVTGHQRALDRAGCMGRRRPVAASRLRVRSCTSARRVAP